MQLLHVPYESVIGRADPSREIMYQRLELSPVVVGDDPAADEGGGPAGSRVEGGGRHALPVAVGQGEQDSRVELVSPDLPDLLRASYGPDEPALSQGSGVGD